jgi:hypothetical protein
MDEISFALNPPRFVKSRRNMQPIRIARSPSPVWPLPALNGRQPVILATTQDPRGIEFAYAREGAHDLLKDNPPGTPNGTDTHVMPQMAAVLSFHDGVITFAGRLGDAFGMIINHGNGTATHYRNLKSLACIRTDLYNPREQYVHAGKTIGYIGAAKAGEFMPLYFELWHADRDRRFVPIDPRPQLRDCKLVQHYDRFTPAPPAVQKEAA